jgi:hypothetical protein
LKREGDEEALTLVAALLDLSRRGRERLPRPLPSETGEVASRSEVGEGFVFFSLFSAAEPVSRRLPGGSAARVIQH